MRLIKQANGIVNINGNVKFVFDPVPMGTVWTGNIVVTGAPSGSTWVADVLGTVWGTWPGAFPFGPIQAYSGETVTVTGGGLVPGTAITAIWTGLADDEENVAPTAPLALAGTPGLRPLGQFDANVTPPTMLLLPSDAYLVFVMIPNITDGATAPVRILPNSIKAQNNLYPNRVLGLFSYVVMPIIPGFDTGINISFVILPITGAIQRAGSVNVYASAIPIQEATQTTQVDHLYNAGGNFAKMGASGIYKILWVEADMSLSAASSALIRLNVRNALTGNSESIMDLTCDAASSQNSVFEDFEEGYYTWGTVGSTSPASVGRVGVTQQEAVNVGFQQIA